MGVEGKFKNAAQNKPAACLGLAWSGVEMDNQAQDDIVKGKKPYDSPAVVEEIELETRAGSPLGIPNPFDPTGELLEQRTQ